MLMNELEYGIKREIVSVVLFHCVKIRECSSVPGVSVELLHEVGQELSDARAVTCHVASLKFNFFYLTS